MKDVQKMVYALTVVIGVLITREIYDLQILSYLMIGVLSLLCASGYAALLVWPKD